MRKCVLPVLLFPFLLTSGCALIPLSAVSSVISLGDSSVSQGRESYFWGKLHTAEMGQFEQARLAVKATAGDLELREKWPEKLTKNRSEMAFVDNDGSQIGIRIDHRAGNLEAIRIDVGWFGSEVTDRLFLARLRAHLPDPAARPVVAEGR